MSHGDPSVSPIEPKREWPLIERVRVLNLAPDDIVIFDCAEELEDWQHADLQDAASRSLGHKVLLLPPGLTLAAVIRAKASQREASAWRRASGW